MSRKEILIICLIMCFILSLQTAVAADVDNNNTTVLATQDLSVVSNNVSAYSLPNSNSILQTGSGDAGTFSELQSDISSGGLITLERNYTFDSSSDSALTAGIVITKNTEIVGNGIVIDANNQARVFRVAKDATVTLRGITFINANPAQGPGGSIFGTGVVHIDNCKFINNTANYANGGAVSLAGFGSTITNSYFEGNRAIKNPANVVSGGAGAVFLNASNITISHSVFVKNMAGLNGGAVGSSGTGITNCTITYSNFTGNNANGSAGAVGMQSSNFIIAHSNFTNNTANGMFSAYPGNGGALVMRGWDSKAVDCIFINNTANTLYPNNGGRGGAAFLTNTSYNPSNNNTGFIHCTFINNTAAVNGGAVTWAKGATYGFLNDSMFINNTAKRSGGAVYWYGTDGTVKNTTFINNTALAMVNATDSYGGYNYGGFGGAIMWVGTNGTVDNCTFKYNEAKYNPTVDQGGRGGAVYLQGSTVGNCTNTTFSNNIFIGNIAGTNGGAIDWHEGAHEGKVINSTFEDNVANSNGGAIYWRGHDGDIIGSNFTNNTAKGMHPGSYGNAGDGGAIFWAGLNGYVEDCRFINNTAAKRGGAAYLEPCNHGNENTTFDNCTFISNNAGTNGGAIDWREDAHDGKVLNSRFENNIANRSGGAIYWSGHNGTIQHSNFTHNIALGIAEGQMPNGTVTLGGDAGAVMWTGAIGTVDDCRFINNTAAKRGGAVFLQAGKDETCYNTTFSNSKFFNNTAGTNGGAIDWHGGAVNGTVEYCEFENNTANRSAGAIFWNGHNGKILHTNFTQNEAKGIAWAISVRGENNTGGDGGAVMWSGALGTVDDCRFINNTAAKRGGGVFLQSASDETCDDTTFKYSYFESNVAGTNGGAIDWNEGAQNGIVDHVTFIDNTAHANGGAIFWHGYNGTVKHSTFTNNRATGEHYEYDITLTMNDVITINSTDITPSEGKLYILKTTSPNLMYQSYVVVKNGTDYTWIKLWEEVFNDAAPSTTDWGIDHFFGGDGGSILWIGNLGNVYNCTFLDSNSARRGGGAYMTGSDNITFELCSFENCTSGTNGGGLDWLAGANNGKVIDCNFTNTRAARSAGAIYYDGDYGEMRNIIIKNTTAYGGDLNESKDGKVKYAGWDSSHWDTNTTGGDAGAIMFTGDNIKVYNVNFTDCTAAGRGGAVFLQDNNNVTFELCRFENNRALGTANNTYVDNRDPSSGLNKWLTGNGGAVAFDLGASNGTIKDATFINNTAARNGGAVSFAVGSTEGYIFNSSFINNTAARNGGAFDWDGTNGNVSYCNFTGNSALGTVIGTEFANITGLNDIINKTGATTSALGKPSVATDNKLYVLVVPEGNKIARYELYVSQVADTHYWLKIDETTETGPSPIDWAMDEYFGGDGGSIYWAGDNATIDHCNFLDSNSARRGGGAYMTGGDHVSYINCTFENCTSGTNGGGLDWLAGANYGKVIDCNFTNTRAARSAGAIYYDGDYGEFRNIIIKNTTAYGGDLNESEGGKVKYAGWDSSHWDTNTTGGDAGAIMLTGDNIKLYNVNITNSTAAGRGGAIFVQDNDNVTIELCRFENNRALGTANNTFNDPHDTSSGLNNGLTGHGGAIAFDVGATSSSIINSTFTNNSVSGKEHHGGAVYFREGASEDKIINSTFTLNHADEDGGALFIDGDECELHNSTFTSNYAGDDGGAIFWKGDLGIIYNITCVNNSGISSNGNSKGGTVCLNGNNISLSNSSFKQSYAKVTGGAIFVTGDYVNITGSQFEDCNVTTETGGAIQIVGNHVEVRNSTFEDCHAPNGGAIYAEGQYVKIIDSNFTNNNVTKDGAALYVNGDYSELHNSTFMDNVAGDDGGAIYWQGSHGTIYNITCENNKGINLGDSNSNGGSICLTGSDVTLSDSTFKNSSAGADGGAIFVTGDNVNILSSEFESCNSTAEGGAIYVLGHYTTISGCTLEDCNATQGGAIYVEGNSATISVNITDTHATGADSYGIVVDYKLYKDNVKEIKYDINDTIVYVVGIKMDDTFTNETLTDLNTNLTNLYAAVDSILTDDGINMTNVTKALAIVTQLNETLTQLNASLSAGKDKNITLQLISDIENIGSELNYLIDISETLEVPSSVTAEIDGIIAEVEAITPGGITDENKTDLLSTLDGIRSDVDKILNGTTFNATNIEHALELLDGLTDTLKELNATLSNGNDKNTVINLLGEVKDIENQLNNLSDLVVVPEVVSQGGAIYISGNNALIDNSVINDTDALYGGGLYIAGHDVKVDNSEFINLYSGEDGGAIYITGQRGNLYNSKFINNTAGDDGGAINWDGNYGKIYNITCENNRGISFNGSSSNGGTISLTGNDTSIEKSSFSDTYALISGGAIFVTGNRVNITDSEFKDCNVSMDIADTHKSYANGGGAIYVFGNSSNIINCTFDNSDAREGGAIYVQGDNVTIDKATFTDSFAVNGGALYVHGENTTISNSTVDDSTADKSGGAVFVDGIGADIIKSSFNNTYALGSEGNGGGAIFIKGENADVIESNFTNNYANSNSHAKGGAMYITGANAEVVDSIFNNVHSNLQGGAIYVNGTDTHINGSEFYGCNVDSDGSEGGAIYIEGENTIIEDSSFVDSSAKYRGGAIYIDGANAKVKDSNFTDSSVTGGKYSSTNPRGGAIYIKAAGATVEGSIFNNSAVSTSVGEGGAVYIEGDYAKILDSEFASSEAYVGGTIYLEGSYCTVNASSFNDSYSNSHGGAMYSTGSYSMVYGSNFTNNVVKGNGGAIFWYGGSKSKYNTVDGCIFINNTAKASAGQNTRGGGAIYWSENGEHGTVKNSEFYYNSAVCDKDKVDGGAILWDKSFHALVDNCIFIGNYVYTNANKEESYFAQGGAMYLRPKQNYTIKDSLFENCWSSKEGGALYIQSDGNNGNVLVENTKFINNTALGMANYTAGIAGGNETSGGGAVMIKQVREITFKNVTFTNNTANKGGAVSALRLNGLDKTFDNCTFENNTATEKGGAIYLIANRTTQDQNNKLFVKNSNFTGNKAPVGSAIYSEKSFRLTNVILLNNTANTSSLTLNKAADAIDITLDGWDNLLNSIYVTPTDPGMKTSNILTVNNVKYWTNNDYLIGKEETTPSQDQSLSGLDGPTLEKGISLTVELFDANNNKLNVGNDIFATDANGELQLTPSEFGLSSFDDVYVKARLTNEDYYTQVELTTRLPVTMEGTADNVTYHRNATVHVAITKDTGSSEEASGIISVYYGDVFLGNITVTNGAGESIDKILTNITADKFLEVGTHNLTLRYWGDLYNDAINITVPINVTKAQSNITLDFDDIGYDLYVTVKIVDDWNDMYYADATGNATVTVYKLGSTTPLISRTVYIVNGTGLIYFDLLPANYTIKAVYNGDDNYNASVNSSVAELRKKEDVRIVIDINATDIMVDENVHINITVLTNTVPATGNVTLYLDNHKYILPLTDSKATFNSADYNLTLDAGFKIVTVCYDGSRDLQANYGDANFTVSRYNTTFTINVTNITHNQKEIINVTFRNDTEGVVYIYVNDGNYSAVINNRTAILELSNLTVGEHNVTVIFPGDWKFNNVTNMTRFYVVKVIPEVIINVDNVTYGDPTKVIINVPNCVSGNVSIKIDGTPYGEPKQINNSKVEFDLGNLDAGNYTVEAIYRGDTNHTAANYTQKFRVYKANRTVTVDVQDIVHGAAEHITVHVDAAGNVTITVNGKSETVILDNGVAELDVYNLTAKTYTVYVTYNGNDNYNKSSASETFTVAKMTTSLDVQVHNVPVRDMEYINITVLNSTGEVAKDLNGTLTIDIDGVSRTARIVNGTASFNSTEFNKVIGQRTVWVFFDGDVNFTASRTSKSYQVTTRLLDDSEWSVTAQNITIGQAGNVTVKLPKEATGFVEIEVKAYDGYRDDVYYAPIKNGEAVVYPMDLRGGKYHVYATYVGTDYEESYLDTYFTVSKAKVNVTIDVNDTVYDGTSNIVVYVDDGVEGSITLKINTTVIGTFGIVDGKVTTTVKLGAENYTLYAEYNGNYMYYDNKTEFKSFTVAKAAPVITIDPVTVDTKTSPVIIVHINDTATGTLNITVNRKNYTADIIDGVATFDMIPVLPAGIYNVTANYYALTDTNYTVGSKYVEIGVTVNKIAPYPMNVSALDVAVEANTTIVVCVPTDATGNVTIWVNGTKMNKTITDATGRVIFSLNKTLEGKYTVNATLSDDKYVNQTVYTNYCVRKVDTPISIISISDSALVETDTTITVSVPEDIKGTVTLEINGKPYTNGQKDGNVVTFIVSDLAYGDKTVVATYSGDNKYRFNSTTGQFTVYKHDSSITVSPTDKKVGEDVRITVTDISQGATGYVIVEVIGVANYTINLTSGQTYVDVKGLSEGTYYVNATYIGDDYYNSSYYDSASFTVSKWDAAGIVVSAGDIDYGNPTDIVVTVPSADMTGTIYLELNDTARTHITLPIYENKVTWNVDGLAGGKYTVYATYSGNDKYNGDDSLSDTFEVRRITPIFNIIARDSAQSTKSPIVGNTAEVVVSIYGVNLSGEYITIDGLDKDGYRTAFEYVESSDTSIARIVTDSPLEYKQYNVRAYYAGNENYTDKTTTYRFTPDKISDYSISIEAENITFKDDEIIYVNVPDGVTSVSIWVNGTKVTNDSVTGTKARFDVTEYITRAGVWFVNATVNDEIYASKVAESMFTVAPRNTTLDVDVHDADIWNNEYINVTIKDANGNIITDASGKVNITLNDVDHPVSIGADGVARFNTADLRVGVNTVSVYYAGNVNYVGNYSTATFTVNQRTPKVNVAATNVSVDDPVTITVTIPSNATGYVVISGNFTDNDIHVNNTEFTGGVATVDVTGLANGTYSVHIKYYGLDNDNYTIGENDTKFKVSKLDATGFVVSADNITYTDKTNIVVTVPDGIAGNITLRLNDTSVTPVTLDIVDGKVVWAIDNLPAGNYTVYATYNGNYKYNINDTLSAEFDVYKLDPGLEIVAVDSVADQKATITIRINGETKGDTVNITGLDKPYNNVVIQEGGIVTLVTDGALDYDDYTVLVTYGGGDNFNASSKSHNFHSEKISDYTITVTPVNITFKDDEIITVTVPDGVTSVSIWVNGTKIDNNSVTGTEAKFNVTDKISRTGVYFVNATVNDVKYASKVAESMFTVIPRNTTLLIDVHDVDIWNKEYINVTIKDADGNIITDASGNLTININGVNYTAEIISGVARYNTSNLAVGVNNVIAYYAGERNYVGNFSSKTFIANQRTPKVNVTATNVSVDDQVTITVTIPANATGYVVISGNFTDNDIHVGNSNFTDGLATINVTGLDNGTYSVHITYVGSDDDQYSLNVNDTTFRVDKILPNINATVSDGGIIGNGTDVNITIHAPSDITGKVNVTVWDIDNINTTYIVYVNEGEGKFSIESPGIGLYNVTVTYLENRKYLENRNYTAFEVYDNEKSLNIVSDDVSVFDNERIMVYLTGDQTGNNLTIIITNANGEIIRNENVPINHYIPIYNGSSAEWELPIRLEAGHYNVTAIYKEYAGLRTFIHEGNNSFEVYKEKSEITIKEIKNTTVGNNVTIELDLTLGATGNISVFVNGLEHKTTADNLTIIIPNLGADVYSVEAYYSGDDKYNASSKTSSFRVDKNNVPLSISTANLGDVEQINVTVGNNATGEILLDIGGNHYYANITDGVAQFNITGLKAGKHNVTARYVENSKYYANSTSDNFTISKYQPEFTINGTDIDFGKAEIITIETKDDITSLVTVEVNDRNYTTFIKEGKGNLTLADLKAGDYNITLYFPASDKYESATANNTFKVRQITPDIHIDVQNSTYGEIVTVTVFVNAEGNVTIKVGDQTFEEKPIIDGVVSVDVSGLNANNYTVNVTYNGNANFTASNAEANFTVEKADPIISVEVENIVHGDTEYIVVHVNARGNVTITINGTGINETISLESGHHTIRLMASKWNVEKYDGKASLDVENLAVGTYDVTVTYNGNENYNTATETAEFNVTKADSAIKVDADAYIKVGDNATVTVTLPENATGNVTVEIDGVKYTSDNITDGVVKFTIENLTYGNKTIAITYSGDGNYSANFTTAKLVVDKYASSVNATIKPAINVGENPTITVEVPQNATGYVIVEINNESYAINVTDGARSATIKGLSSGEYPITVTYLGDDKYFASNTTSSIKVSKMPSTVNVTVQNITVGDKEVINISVPEDLCGNVTVSVNGENHTVYVSGGHGTLVLEDLEVGNYTVDAIFDGCRKYEPSNSTAKFEVSPVKVDEMKVIDQGNGTLTILAPDIENGTVTVKVGNETYNVTVVDGVGVVDLVNNTPGTYNVTVIYEGDDTHAPAAVEGSVTVPKYPSEISVDASEVTEGEPLVITVEVPDGATGNVTVIIDGKEYPGEVKDGVAVVTVDNLTAGNKTYVVKYSGDGNFSDTYTIGNVTVKEDKSDSDIIVVDQGNGTIAVIIGDNATGNVTVFVDGKNITAEVKDGVVIIELENVTPGTHEIEVVYSGDDTHKSATTETSVTAPKYETEIEIDVGEATEGEPVTITVKVPENATGNVTVYVDGKEYPAEVKDGVAVVTVDNLTAGSHTVAVKYSGDGNYSGETVISNFTVKEDKEDSEIVVVDQGNGTVVVIVGDNATGNVTLNIDGKNITVPVVDGVAVVDLGNVTPGTHDVEVIYSGDDTHKPATTETSVTAPKYETEIEIDVGEATEGEPVTITVKVPENATGNVTVYVDGKEYPAEVKDGVAVVTVDNLTAGDKTITVKYSGDGNYSEETVISNFTVKESKADSDIIVVDQGNGTVVVIVGDNATGNVTLNIDGKNITVPVVDGVAVVDLGNVTPGAHDVEVIYSGDDTHRPATAQASITAPKLETPITVDVVNSKVGQTNTITVNVPDGATGNITLAIDGETYTSEIRDGKAVFTFDNLTAGNKTIAVDYIGDDNYVANHTIANVTVSKHESFVDATITDIDVGENVTVTVTVPDDATGQVLIDIGGVGYYVNVTDGTGTVQIPRMPNGAYYVTLTYTGDDKYEPSSTTAEFTVEKIPSFVKPYAQDIFVGENEVIRFVVPQDATGTLAVVIGGEEFNFNLADGSLGSISDPNKFSVAVSGGEGILVVSGLPKGEYIVSVKYNGDGKYLSSTNETSFKVIKNDTSVHDDGNGTITIDLPDNATGYITVLVGNHTYYAKVVNGTVTVNLVNETPGKHNVTVIYSGDEYHDSQVVHIIVDIPKLETPISVDVSDINVGQTAVITVSVPEKATGNVTIEIDGVKYTQSIENGKAVFYIDGLTAGNKTIAVKYEDDIYYVANSTTAQFNVNKCESTISATSRDINVGNDEVITAYLPKDATGRVLVDINGVGYYGEVINGMAKIIVPELPSGVYSALVTYEGDDKYLSSTTTVSFTVTKVQPPISATGGEIQYGDDATITVILPEDATGTVTITVDGKSYTEEVKDGKAVFVVPGLSEGDHEVTASYSGDRKYSPSQTVADVEVSNPDDPNNPNNGNGSNVKTLNGVIDLSKHATGNPIWILLLIVLAIGSARLKRFKK